MFNHFSMKTHLRVQYAFTGAHAFIQRYLSDTNCVTITHQNVRMYLYAMQERNVNIYTNPKTLFIKDTFNKI